MIVLVVEDNEDSRVLLETVFKAQGHDVLSADNGEAALSRVQETLPDLIVSDILMPEMDGYSLCRAIKSDPGYRSIPFVFYSATFTEPDDIRYAMDLGASRFIVKPTEVDIFLREVDEVMAEHDSGELPSGIMDVEPGEVDVRHAKILFNKLDKKVRDLDAERARLRQSEARFFSLVNNAPVGFFAATPEGWLLEANKAMAEMMGYGSPSELLNECAQTTHPYLEAARKDDMPGLLQENPDGAQINSRLVLHGGRELFLSLTIWPVLDFKGMVERLEGVAMDVTRQQKAEEYLAGMEKTMAIGGVAAGMAHEINNPLATIIGNMHVALRRLTLHKGPNARAADDAGLDWGSFSGYLERRKITDLLTVAGDAARRASTIVKNMVKYSSQSECNCSPHNIVDVLEATIEFAGADFELKKLFDFKAITLNREFYMNLPPVVCDPDTMQQVFFNILKNGAEAMATSSPEERAPRFILRAVPDGDHVRVEIEDNGPGMEESVQSRLFEPFFTTKQKNKGTGLGLSISHFIVTEKHGGQLLVESIPGQGTTFIIRLPIGDGACT